MASLVRTVLFWQASFPGAFGPLVRASAERTICLPEYAEALRASGVRAVYEARAKGRHVSALFYVGGWWEADGDAAREFWRRARAPSSAV